MAEDRIPFSFVKAVVTGENFIGRKQLLRELRSNALARTTTFVVGLPRMGKTSLVKQCFMQEDNQKEWMEKERMAPLYVMANSKKDSKAFWKSIARELWSFLRKKKIHLDFLDDYLKLSDAEDIYQLVMMALGTIKEEHGISFVIILDEFDGVRHYPQEDDIFQKIRSLGEYGVVITCSRRTPDFIEKESTGGHYFTDNGKQLFVGLFNEDDVKEYWSHFSCHFADFDREQLKSYKDLVKRYVGYHPMLMSLMNYWLFNQGDEPFKVWNPKLPAAQREEVERSIRAEIKKAFLRQMDYVEEQGLKTAAIQLVVGTSRAVPEDEVDLLLRYQFIQAIPSQEKTRIFGYNLGPTTADFKKRYICFSELTSHLMKDLYDPDIKGYELLKETELKFREVITEVLWDICDGEDPFTIQEVRINPQENLEERELWEKALYSKIPYFSKNKKASDDFLYDLDAMRDMKEKRESYDCKPTFDRRMINMVTSTTLGQLWHVFFKWQWLEYFAEIFQFRGDKEKWHNDVFNSILDWRNAADHHNDEELPDSFVDYASSCARDVIKSITAWMGTQGTH